MRRNRSRATRAIALGDKSNWELFQESVSKQAQRERVYVEKFHGSCLSKNPTAALTPVYSANGYSPHQEYLFWASVALISPGRLRKRTGNDPLSEPRLRGLLTAIFTFKNLVDGKGYIYYCDDPALLEPWKRKAAPTAANKREQRLWNVLFRLSAEREVRKLHIIDSRNPLLSLVRGFVREEMERCAATHHKLVR